MNQETNQKKVENLIEQKEEKDFLAREEVKTMQKDMSRLREIEARRERERVAKIKTEEEIIRDQERQKMAEQASTERSLAEKEAKEREEKISRIREEREIKQSAFTQTETEKKEVATGEFRGALRETQNREEELRKRFMARVEAKAEGKEEVVPPPLPPIPPIAKVEKKPIETAKTLFKKPSSGQKVWVRVVLSLLIVAVLALAATFAYWYFSVRETTPIQKPENNTPVTPEPEVKVKELVIPPSLFYTESSQTLKISEISEVPFLLFQALQGKTEQGSVSRILLEDTKNIEILGLKEIFAAFNIAPPENFYDQLATSTTLFIYSQEEGNRLGMVTEITEEGLPEIMSLWEETMEQDMQSFFELLNKTEPALYSYFRDASYQETDFRFQTFSRQDLGIVYTVFDNYFILTTSWKSMEKALDKLKEAALSSFFSPDGGAEFVLENMNSQGKIGQLFFIGINGTTLTAETEKLIADIQPGGILLLKKNIIDEIQTKTLIRDIQRIALKNYGIPLFIGVDQEGGNISPVNFIREKTAQSEIKSADQAFAVGLSRGEELKDLGINLNLAPVLDETQPGDFLFSRAFQTTVDSDQTALAKALISGQKTASILTAIKHFPGYGDIAFDPEDKLATLDQSPQISLFETAAEAKPEFIMTSNVIYTAIDDELPFSFSPEGIALLKQSVGSDPLIMTDDLPQQSLIDKFSLKGVVTLPIKAGVDVLTFSNNWETTLPEAVRILKEAVQNEEISQEQIDDSVLKIIKLKKAYYYYE